MRPDSTEEIPAARLSDMFRDEMPPRPRNPHEDAVIWRARRERAWTAAGWLATAVLAAILVIALVTVWHVLPPLLGLK